MITIKIFAYKIAPILPEGVSHLNFKAIGLANDIADTIAEMLGVKATCDSCGVVQYHDTIVVEELAEDVEQMLLASFPFISIRKPLFPFK